MSTAVSVYHGPLGRVTLYHLNRPMIKHAHREGHLTFWVDGASATMAVKDVPATIGRESGTAANPWEMHEYIPHDPVDGQHALVLYIKPSWFLDFDRHSVAALRFGRPEIELTQTIAGLVGKIVALMAHGGATDLLDGYLYELTAESYQQSHQWLPGAQEVQFRPQINDFRVRKSIKLITDNIGNELDMGTIASESGLSRPHFFKLFREQIGVTPKLYWNTIRMEKALRDLAETGKHITDIGFDLGFSSQSSFSRFFAQNAGMAPTDYRRVAHVLN